MVDNIVANINIFNEDGWFFEKPMENKIHIINSMDIEMLFLLSEIEEQRAKEMMSKVAIRDKDPYSNKSDPIIDMILANQVSGTGIRYPFGISSITFPSKRHLFRGEPQIYAETVPSLNRKIKNKSIFTKLMMEALSFLRIHQFHKFIWKMNVVPYWEAKISDINVMALAQHYGFDTHLLDLTNEILTALFFANCKYVPEIDGYRPMTKEDFAGENKEYGVIFHTPDWQADYLNGVNVMRFFSGMRPKLNVNLMDGSCDGVAFQIGLQPLWRCHCQSGYILPMVKDMPLQKNWIYEKMYFLHSEELSNRIFNLMDGGEKIFPNEGISQAKCILDNRLIYNRVVAD